MRRKGDTVFFEHPPRAVAWAAVGGKKEGEGPLAQTFDVLLSDTTCGEKSWEKAESDVARYALETALKKANLTAAELDGVFAGDLECQCTASAYAMRGFDVPYLGLYGACSTMAEGVGLAACMVASGAMRRAAAIFVRPSGNFVRHCSTVEKEHPLLNGPSQGPAHWCWPGWRRAL